MSLVNIVDNLIILLIFNRKGGRIMSIMPKKKLLLAAIIFCFSVTVSAQIYRGKIIDSISQQLVAFANVELLQKTDSSFIAGATTDTLGNFSLNAKQNNYLLKISFLGYETKIIEVNSTNIGTVPILQDTKNLSEVTVTASRPIIKMENGGISTDIQNSYLKNLGTAQDVLGQLPFVHTSRDDIMVFGKGTPLIYLNNRIVRDISELSRINSNQIKKVTVITNPGAEYDASVQSIIRIETIKQVGDGLSGNLMLGATVNHRFSHNETLHLTYRYKNLDIFGTLGYGKRGDFRKLTTLSQTTNSSNVSTEVTQTGNSDLTSQSYNTSIGTNYTFNKNHSAGIMFQKSGLLYSSYLGNSDFTVRENNVLMKDFKSIDNTKNTPYYRNYLNAYYDGKFTDWLSAKLNIDYANGCTFSGTTLQNFRPDSTETIKTKSKTDYSLHAAKFILTSPLWQGQLEYGYEFSKTVNNQVFNVIESGESNVLESSQGTQNQMLNAGFFTYSKEMGKFSASLGVRYENVNFQYFNEKIKDNESSRVYNNFFPSASITYIKDKLQMQLSYRNSTDRPSYYQLRSEIQYDNPYYYEGGNPYLKPTETSTLSYMLVWKDLVANFDYNIYKNLILYPLSFLTENILFLQPINVANARNSNISVTYSPTVKHWKPSLELSLSKGNIKYGNPVIYYNKPVGSVRLNNNITLNGIMLGANFSYDTKGNSSITYYYDTFHADLFLSRRFFNNKLRVNLGANDIFGGYSHFKDLTIGNNCQKITIKDYNARNVKISISYDFNTTKSKYKGEHASDELNRL